MSNTSNFRNAIQEAKQNALVGPNVIQNALPFLGAGLVLTAVGAWGGLKVISNSGLQTYNATYLPASILFIVLFISSQIAATKGKNDVALPLLATFSLVSGYTLSLLMELALKTPGVGETGLAIAALSCGITFIAARPIGGNLSDEDGFALTKTFQLGLGALLVVVIAQAILMWFGIITPSWMEIGISGFGVLLFVGAAVVDFFVLPRTYEDEQYLSAALSMYMTYVNLFIFILRFLIAINSRD
ncbi:Bax inhibitor-1 family protein [Acaryochloris marina]|uniref:Bax inhibitor-1/YccA family protein n=1 Tax=Acaryochloris marina TaxID=155978 RepID=UPI001BAF5856|nr:Bax inhibitor-1 family protein [Acaryochloris marina]QUY43504.1 US12 family protein [Acaryochloris marina S15]